MKKSLLPFALLGAFGLAFSGPYDTWTKYRNVTVDGTAAGITGAVANYPLLVRLTSSSDATGGNVLSEAKPAGADIRFTTGDGNTPLAYQIERWTSTAAEIWVKVPSVTTSATSIRLYWGKASAVDSSLGTAVFDTAAGFRAVWHMNTSGNQVDATANALIATVGATAPTDTTTGLGVGKRFGARDVGTTTGYVVAPEPKISFAVGTAPYTLSVWANPVTCNFSNGTGASNGNRMMVMGRMNKVGRGQYAIMTPAANNIWQHRLNTVTGTSAGSQWSHYNKIGTGNACVADKWQFLSVSFSGTATDSSAIFGYLNGMLMDSTKVSGSSQGFTDSTFTIGRASNDFGTAADSSFRFRGSIDEVRISSGVRSPDWHRLDFQTQRPDSAKVTLGTTQTVGVVTPFSNWSQSRSIRLNTGVSGANVASMQRNFPVLIRLTSAEASIISQAKAGGADIRFAKSNDSSLPYQIERWDAGANRAEIWVKVDTVKGNDSTQTIKMYWGNAAATTASNGSAVFDTANGYASVWHLGDATGIQARPNAIAGRFAATPVSFAAGYQPRLGMVGLADSLSGGSNADSTTFLKIAEGDSSNYYRFPAGQFTYSAWVAPTTVDNFARLISLVSDNGTSGVNRIFLSFNGGNIIGRVYGTASHATNSTTPPVTGDWNHIAMTVNRGPSLDTTRLYLNGLEIATSTHNPMPNAQRNYVRIGKDQINPGSDLTYNGKIDEAQLSHVTRSADFLRLSYESQRTFQRLTNIGLGAVTVPGVPTGVTGSAGANGSGQVTVAWTAPAANGGSAITGYKAMAVSDTTKFCTVTTGATTCTVTGLTNGTAYTFVVKATNSAGTSGASLPSAAVTVPVGIAPGAFAIHVNGSSRPYSFRLSQDEMFATEAVTLKISDIHGRTVWSQTVNPARDHVREITWNGKALNGTQVSAGMYVVRVAVTSGGKTTEIMRKTLDLSPGR